MSKEDKKRRLVIPYSRKDTPMEGSQFSSILQTLVLTIMYFKDQEYKLDKEDIKLLFNISDNILGYYVEKENLKLFMDTVLGKQEIQTLNDRSQIIERYVSKYLSKRLQYHEKIKNCSFIDIMNKGLWSTDLVEPSTSIYLKVQMMMY